MLLLEFLLRAVLLLVFAFGLVCFVQVFRIERQDRTLAKQLLRWFFGCTIFVIIIAWLLGL